jgi:ASC-1-like (ASCH) protein
MSNIVGAVSSMAIKNFKCHFHVQPRYFNLILQGQKTVEGRVAREKYLSLRPGDAIQFLTQETHLDQKLLSEPMIYKTLDARVVSLEKFNSFSDMLSFYGLKNCLPGVKSLSEGVSIYHGFPGYESDAKSMGAVGIEIEIEI